MTLSAKFDLCIPCGSAIPLLSIYSTKVQASKCSLKRIKVFIELYVLDKKWKCSKYPLRIEDIIVVTRQKNRVIEVKMDCLWQCANNINESSKNTGF